MKPIALFLASAIFVFSGSLVNAAEAAPASASTPAAVAETPDGSPSLPRDTTITHTTADSIARDASTAPNTSEERIESRLAVIRNGRATITDPNVGRYDRAAASGQRRVTPTMWQVFRF